MALTYSSMLELDSKIPHFKLKNVLDGQMYASSSLSNDKPSLIMIICNHCPYVIHYHEELKKMNHDLGDQIDFLAISSNDIENYPQDGPERGEARPRIRQDQGHHEDRLRQVGRLVGPRAQGGGCGVRRPQAARAQQRPRR